MEISFGDLSSLVVWQTAGLIFILRVIDMSLGTLRLMVTLRGHNLFGWFLGFFQALVFVMAISSVLQNLDSMLNIIAYSAGYASGGVIGNILEEKLAIGFTHMRIISPNFGTAIANKLREEGYGVTEVSGRGKDGSVTLINASVRRKKIKHVHKVVAEIDPKAFITSEDLRPVRRGFWRA